ncbi:MAG: chemotaxis protein CheW [Candidatus Sedimenticola sp. (ex Thyasira tokunagai)]
MAETNSSNEVRGVLLPLNSGKLLLPNAAISEVVSYRQPEQLDGDKPGWLLGHFSWRQQQIPLVCFDSLVGRQAVDVGTRARIAISNTLNGNPDYPFIGILLRSVPHLVRVSKSTFTPVDVPRDLGEVVQQQVIIEGEEAWIPNLDILEWLVSEQLS